jgi:hypothetical protein
MLSYPEYLMDLPSTTSFLESIIPKLESLIVRIRDDCTSRNLQSSRLHGLRAFGLIDFGTDAISDMARRSGKEKCTAYEPRAYRSLKWCLD